MPIVLHNEGDTPKGIYVVRDNYIKYIFMIKTLIEKATMILDPNYYKNVMFWLKSIMANYLKALVLLVRKE